MPKRKDELPQNHETIIEQPLEEVVQSSMMPYAEHAILERALPRVEDGLKPVQRRILYTMMELGITPDKPHRKSARIVGDTMGKYHPHGDSSIYDAMVRMAQEFNMGERLVDGHGNFGSIDGDSPAAMRYTEARLTPLALEMLRDIEKETVSFSFNFDDSLKEPDMLPGRFPNLLVNGAMGIAVGLATNIPTHNLGEVIDAVVAQIDNPQITLDGLMEHIKGPDFPTGGFIIGREGIRQAYETGKGRIVMRAKAEVESAPAGKSNIVITEMPYQTNKAALLQKILELSESKKGILSGINDIRDESDRTGMRAVIEIKKDHDANKILEYLYKYSDLQSYFNVNMVAIAQGKPELLTLKKSIEYYIAYQKDVVRRRTQFDLEKAEAREHILIGLKIAVVNIDEVVRLIRASDSPASAKKALMNAFQMTGIQAQAVLDMRLQRLTSLEVIRLEQEIAEVQKLIAEYKAILRSPAKLMQVIKDELMAIRKNYASRRKTRILDSEKVVTFEESDFIMVEETVAVVTYEGFVKRINAATYGRSNRKIPPDNLSPDDQVRFVLPTNTARKLLLFTSQGNMVAMACADLPEMRWRDKGEHLSGIINGYAKDERVVFAMEFENMPDKGWFLFVNNSGMVKKTLATEYDTKKRKVLACALKEGDSLVSVMYFVDESKICLVSAQAMAIVFKLSEVPEMGRSARGVKGMTLSVNDQVLLAFPQDEEGEVLLMSDRGYGKRLLMVDLEAQARGGKGGKVFAFNKNQSNGTKLCAVLPVKEPFVVSLWQKSGQETQVETESISISSKTSTGTPVILSILGDDVVKVYRVQE